MAISFVASNSLATSGGTELDLTNPAGTAAGDLIVSCFAFENVAAGSGPWIVPNIGQLSTNYIGPSTGWEQVCWQSPSLAGVGIEVWCARIYSGTVQYAKFAAAQNAVGVNATYRGIYDVGNPVSNGTVRVATTAQVTGNQPAAPSVAANVGELVVAIFGDLMTGAGFGSPSGFTSRVDTARAGAGTVEAAIVDGTPTAAGATGPITSPQNAAASSTRGATATLAIVPAPTGTSVGPILDVPMPADLDLADGWTLRMTALDPLTGAVVPGVTISSFALEVDDLSGGGGDGLAFGDFQLVPGPGA